MNRTLNETVKIGRDVTGLKGPVFMHIGRNPDGTLTDIRFSSPWKDGGVIDRLLSEIGDKVTATIQREG